MTTLFPVPIPGTSATLSAAQDGDDLAISLRSACEALGLDYSAQWRRLERQDWATVAVMATVAADGKTRDMVTLDRRTFTMWLATTYRHGIPARETVSYLGHMFTATIESWSATMYPGSHFGVDRYLHGDGTSDLASTDWWADVDEWTDAIDAAAFSPEPPPRWLVAAWCQLFGGAQ